MKRGLLSFAFLAAMACMGAAAQTIHGRDGIVLPAPPAAEAVPVVDDYFGTRIVDGYRWLEEGKSTRTRAFVDAQNAYTARYMKQARIRPDAVEDLDALERVSDWSVPVQRGDALFFLKRLAGEEQASIYVRRGWTAPNAKAGVAPKDERLVDPAALSQDANASVELADVSPDGALVAFEMRLGGADETAVRIADARTGKPLEDELPLGLYRSVCFAPDGKSLYYARSNRQGTMLYRHTLGTRLARDEAIFGREFHSVELGPSDLLAASVTGDGRYLAVRVEHGVPASRVDIAFRDLSKPGAPFEDLVWGLDARFDAIYAGTGAKGGWFVQTDYQAPKGRILKADPGILPDVWKTVVPEGVSTLDGFSVVGGKLYVRRLKDAQAEIAVYGLDGKPSGTVDLEGMGSASLVRGPIVGRYGFYRFESLLAPPAFYRLDTQTGKRELFAQPKVPFDAAQFEVKQAFCRSKDGTSIPLFIAGRKGLKRDGTERLLMMGEGGFGRNATPAWNPIAAWWLDMGGWFALPNLRGGGEYGESWHEQGAMEKKQNAFDDWFATAEYLIAEKYASPERLAIANSAEADGPSNGGLLMGAAIVQRPELFAAALCAYPMLDMLRYQNFLQGPLFAAEYGSATRQKQFDPLLKYSPYQNAKAGRNYPSVFLLTGDGDTRIDPLHARKMAALLQAASSSGRPVLLRETLQGGPMRGTGVEFHVQEDADIVSFLWTETEQSSVKHR
jgi:prolyl oligopeptidase